MAARIPCRLCGFVGMTAALTLAGMPRWNHRLLREHEIRADQGVDLTAYCCPSCGFVSVPMQLSSDYYDDYINAPSLSTQAREFQSAQAGEFVSRFGLSGHKVLEVGCGDGYFLGALRDAGVRSFGIEPSRVQRELACARGLDVESGILAAGRMLAAAPFDAFVTRQVFEHVEDMRDFLLTIRGNLRSGAVGLVEVPNLGKIVEDCRFFDFIPEHINYFTQRSLGLALKLAGFEVLEVSPVQDGESLRALVRWEEPRHVAELASRVDSLRSEIATFLEECNAKAKKVAIWGAGGKGLSMMAVVDVRHVRLLVDSDPHKAGLFTPVSHLPIAPPTELARQQIDAVIVMAPAYEREIAASLRNEWAFVGEIVLAGRGFERLAAVGDSR